MYKILSDVDEAYRYVNEFFPLPRSSNLKGIVLKKNGETKAAALFENYNGTNIYVHLAGAPGRRFGNREFLHWGFHYPFVQLGCKRMTAYIEANNADSIRLAEHMGFRREATLAGAGRDGVDAYIYVMFREDCRYA